jgi:glutathione synthase/RimK-type ligase-like ATP-grasp enzyme
VRFNTERAPQWKVALQPGRGFTLSSGVRSIKSSSCAGVWWRRPETPAAADGVDDGVWEAVREQWRALLRGLATVPGPQWVSNPEALHRAESKALQLAEASVIGFEIPETVWTNDLAVAADALADGGVVKSVATAYWEGESAFFVFARRMSAAELPAATRLAQQPVALQAEIGPKVDVRVTVIGERVFAAALHTASLALDWRLEKPSSWRPHMLPDAVAERARMLVARLGLRFGAIDLAMIDEHRYVFIELNPNGEWGWLQKSGLPLAAAIADELTGVKT